jgi:hypothetical protein
MKLITQFFVSFSKFIINFTIIYFFTRIIEFIARSLNFYIPFEFTFLLIFIVYLIINKIFKLKSFGGLIFGRLNKYKVYLAFAVIMFFLILFGNEVIKAKKVFDVASYYNDYSHSAPDYTDRDSSELVDISTMDTLKEENYVNWINKNGQPPLDYILNEINQHQVLVFGESHGFSNYLIFLNKIIPDLYKVGVRVIAMEVCQSNDNELLEKLVNGKEYDRDLALDIARHEQWLAWGAKDYWDVLESVWKLNKNLDPNQEKMKIIGLESKKDMPAISLVIPGDDTRPAPFYEKLKIFRTLKTIPNLVNNDELMAKQIEEKIIKKNKKGIVWVGGSHSYLNFIQPYGEKGRMAYILHKKFGEKIFQILLHGVENSELLTKFLKDVISKSNFKQIGFDVISSPFGLLRDSTSMDFRNRPLVDFGDIACGYLYLCPVDSLKNCEFIPNFVTQVTFIKEKPFFEAVVGKQLKSADDVNKYYENKFNR